MKFLTRLIVSSESLPLLLVILFGILASRSLIFQKGYFNMHDDLQMMRQLEMEKCFADFQIPCRWVPDMGYGFGFPLFNFYPPLPYLVGEIFRVLGFSFVTVVKLTFSLSFILSGITMYFLAKEFFGRFGGVISAAFYIWAPYHAVDVYVRGAMNEAWALIFFPLILWTSHRLINSKSQTLNPKQTQISKIENSRLFGNLKFEILSLFRISDLEFRYLIALTLSWTGLFLSHNLMVLIFAPVFVGWCLLFLWRGKRWGRIPQLTISGILALALAAFFTFPAVFEQKYVHVDTLVAGYYEYIAHFANLYQLFLSRFWGYGPSVWGETDGMSFQIGRLHWILSIVVAALSIYRYIKTKKISDLLLVPCYFILVGWFSAFMVHVRSTPIWQLVPVLRFVQFPWRFLTIVILSFSFSVGSIAVLAKSHFFKLLFTVSLIAVLLILNWNYFKPERMGALTDEEKFEGAAWELLQTAGIYDYLPKDAKIAPQAAREIAVEYLNNAGTIADVNEGTDWARFKIDGDGGVVRINIFNFPVWRVFVDGKEASIFTGDDELGRIHITIPQGEHEIYAKLYDTPIRTAGNLISLLSWFTLFTYPIWRRR